MSDTLLEIINLRTQFHTEVGIVPAVDDVSLTLKKGEILGVVGESGSGKSVTALSIIRLVPDPPGVIVGGKIIFDGHNLLEKTEAQMRQIRGNEISMIFQEPMTSLNPVHTIGWQIMEAIKLHQGKSDVEALEVTVDMLRRVGIPMPEQRAREYPHQLSGGMRQRVMIAMALSCQPKLLIADEPTTALDVTIQAQILELIKEMKGEFNTSILLITHDLGVIAETCERVAVMYGGKIVEYTDISTLFESPLHPYTQALLKSIPRLDEKKERLQAIRGYVPDGHHLPSGCAFHPRCDHAFEKCRQAVPELIDSGAGHSVRCWHVAREIEKRVEQR